MVDFEQYLRDVTQSFQEINYTRFVVNLVLTALLAGSLAWFYIRFGNAISNRKRFARNFLPLALTTMLIITIVKSSIALSLGLVGALSIVRFRSAIKDPEELTFLFFTIGIGLAAGADQMPIGVVAFVLILGVLFIQALLTRKGILESRDNMHVNIRTTHKDLKGITEALSKVFPFVELKRVDETPTGMAITFVVETNSVDQIETAKSALISLDSNIIISFIEQRNIAL